jgi:hypothetical protein
MDIHNDEVHQDWGTASLPKDFFSKLVSHSATLVPVEEGHPALDREDVLSEADIAEDLEKDKVDLPKIWTLTEARSRGNSDAVRPNFNSSPRSPRSRTVSDATQSPKLRTVSDATAFKKPKRSPHSRIVDPSQTIPSLIVTPASKTTDDVAPPDIWVPEQTEDPTPRGRAQSDVVKRSSIEEDDTSKKRDQRDPRRRN